MQVVTREEATNVIAPFAQVARETKREIRAALQYGFKKDTAAWVCGYAAGKEQGFYRGWWARVRWLVDNRRPRGRKR